MPIRRQLFSISGTSLIEVLITLGIFMTGMVYVIRMFPFGFLSLKHDENVTIANRLAQTELERLQGRPANLPSAILPWGWNGVSNYCVLSDADPDDMGDQTLKPDGGWPPNINMHYFTDVNKFRRISGEATEVPVPTSMDPNGPGSVYTLQFSPIICDPKNDPDNTIIVTAGSLRRKWMGSGSIASQLTSYGDYLIDYEQAKLYIKPYAGSKTRGFYLSYGYWRNNGGDLELQSVKVYLPVEQATAADLSRGYIEINIPNQDGLPLATSPGFEGIDRASDTLARSFSLLNNGDAWSDDPYEFKLVSPITGVIAFNPCGYGYNEYTGRGKTPLVANIDYTVMDWHILREERRIGDTLASHADLDVKLPLRFIKKAGESAEQNGATYNGLGPDYGITADVVAVDVETGQIYTNDLNNPANYLYPQPAPPSRPIMEVDYQRGVIHFDPDAPVVMVGNQPRVNSPLAGKTFRIYYQADGDWALQTYKAYDTYRRSYTDPSSSGLMSGEYFLNNDNTIYFPRSAAGSTVAMDFAYRVNDGPEMFASGRMQQVSRDTRWSNLVYVDLADHLRDVVNRGDRITITRVTRVYGVSLGVRAIWRESGRGFAAGRWRKVDLQTYLAKPAQ